jgi:hypothetical protein
MVLPVRAAQAIMKRGCRACVDVIGCEPASTP